MLNEVDLSILQMLVVFIACSEMRSKLYSNAAKSVRLCSPASCVQQNAVIDVATYISLMFHSVTSHLQTTKEKKKKLQVWTAALGCACVAYTIVSLSIDLLALRFVTTLCSEAMPFPLFLTH